MAPKQTHVSLKRTRVSCTGRPALAECRSRRWEAPGPARDRHTCRSDRGRPTRLSVWLRVAMAVGFLAGCAAVIGTPSPALDAALVAAAVCALAAPAGGLPRRIADALLDAPADRPHAR